MTLFQESLTLPASVMSINTSPGRNTPDITETDNSQVTVHLCYYENEGTPSEYVSIKYSVLK